MIKNLKYFQHYKGFSSNAWGIFLIFFLYALCWPALTFLPLYLYTSLHYSLVQTGSSASVYGVGFVLTSFVGSWLCDRFSAYYVTLAGNLLFILFLFLLFVIHGPYLLVLALLALLGMSNAIFLPSARIFLMRSVPEQDQMRANSVRYMIFNLGTALAFGLVSFIIQGHYGRVFIVGAVCSGMMALCLIACCKADHCPSSNLKKATKACPDRSYLLILLCFFLGMLVFAQTNSTYTLFLTKTYHLSIQQVGSLFLINALIIVLLQMSLTQYAKSFRPVHVMNVGAILMGGGFLLLIFGHSYWLAVISLIILTFGEMLFVPTSQTIAYQAAPENNRGYYMGIYQAIYASTFIFAPLLGTIALNLSAQGYVLWIACMILCLLPGLILRLGVLIR